MNVVIMKDVCKVCGQVVCSEPKEPKVRSGKKLAAEWRTYLKGRTRFDALGRKCDRIERRWKEAREELKRCEGSQASAERSEGAIWLFTARGEADNLGHIMARTSVELKVGEARREHERAHLERKMFMGGTRMRMVKSVMAKYGPGARVEWREDGLVVGNGHKGTADIYRYEKK